MNDTQTKEHIYAASCATAEKHQTSAIEKEKAVEEAKVNYLNAVIQAAIASEMLIRKKDQMFLLCYLGVFAVLALIGLIIGGPWMSVGVILAGFVIRCGVRNSKSTEIDEDFKGRSGFFYMYGVNEHAKRKFSNLSLNLTADKSQVTWFCPNCDMMNTGESDHCAQCGTKKP